MTIHFMASEMAGFVPSDNSSYEMTTPPGYFDTAFSRAGTMAGQTSPTSYMGPTGLALPDVFFTHFAFRRTTTGSSTHTLVSYVDGATEVFRIQATGTTLQMQAYIAAVWTNVGSAVSYAQNVLNHLDLYISGNSGTGTATLYLAGTERATATANLALVTSLNELRFYGVNSASGCVISQCVIDTESTVGGRLFTVPVSGVGATTGWTGAWTEVDEIVYSDADFINSGTANQVSTFAVTAPTLTGYVVRAVGVYARAKRDASGPQNIQLVLRVSGTDYFSATKALGIGYTSPGNIWETNPATAAAWVNTAIAALQPGAKSIA